MTAYHIFEKENGVESDIFNFYSRVKELRIKSLREYLCEDWLGNSGVVIADQEEKVLYRKAINFPGKKITVESETSGSQRKPGDPDSQRKHLLDLANLIRKDLKRETGAETTFYEYPIRIKGVLEHPTLEEETYFISLLEEAYRMGEI